MWGDMGALPNRFDGLPRRDLVLPRDDKGGRDSTDCLLARILFFSVHLYKITEKVNLLCVSGLQFVVQYRIY